MGHKENVCLFVKWVPDMEGSVSLGQHHTFVWKQTVTTAEYLEGIYFLNHVEFSSDGFMKNKLQYSSLGTAKMLA